VINSLFAYTESPYWPFVVLFLSVCFIIIAISYWRMHAFVALLLASLVAGLTTFTPQGDYRFLDSNKEWTSGKWKVIHKDGEGKPIPHLVAVIELIAKGLGDTARDIAISIAFASIIGMCLMESGAADKVVRCFLKIFGEKRAGWALLWSTYILSIPIFFDTMFMLMVPLAKALRVRTGKDYLLYVLCVCCGGVITHSLTIPHPGPLAMVDSLKMDIGVSLAAGLIGGIIPAIVGFFICVFLNSRIVVPLRDQLLSEAEHDKPESELPSLFWSILPVVLPIVLIGFSSLFKVIGDGNKGSVAWCVAAYGVLGGDAYFASVREFIDFFGHKNIALLIGAAISLFVMAKQRGFGKEKLEQLVGPPLETAGMIILITSAGGAFGSMLRVAGVGDAVTYATKDQAINLVVLSYIVAAVIRIAQGSATVSMLTTAAMMAPIISPMIANGTLGFHPLYIYLVIGWGAMGFSWMNDSGFWVVNRLSGMTQRETLQSWTVLTTGLSITGLITTLIASKLLPLI
jgi:gluconate:H+ symporter, GntP family